MASPNYGIDYLLGKVWCNPGVDNQYIVSPARLTADGGQYGFLTYAREKIPMPTAGKAYQIFAVGHIPASFLSLIDTKGAWVKVGDIQWSQNLIMDVYTRTGQLLHKDEIYFMLTTTNSLLFAVGFQPKSLVDFNERTLYFRVYKNHFYTTDRKTGIVVTSAYISTPDDLPNFQTNLAKYKNLGYGYAYAIRGNLMYENVHPFNTKIGDNVDMVYDESIVRVVDFSTKTTPVFDSLLDSGKKFLLHYPANGDDNVYYQDDVDVYVCYKNDRGHMVGVLLPKHLPQAFRQVTHRDYSVSQPLVYSLVQAQGWSDGREIFIRLHVRDGGLGLKLVNTKEKLNELYKLDESSLVGALVGVNSSLPYWNAAYLEKSAYANFLGKQILGTSNQICTKKDVADVLGYTAFSKLVNDLPVKTLAKVQNGTVLRSCDVPPASQEKSVAFMYDYLGRMLDFEPHVNSAVHYFSNPLTDRAEFIPGTLSDGVEEFYQTNNVVINPDLDYRFYACGKYNGVPDYKWKDVTGTSAYQIVNGKAIWALDFDTNHVMIRSNANVLVNKFTADAVGGYVGFTLTQNQVVNGVRQTVPLTISLGDLSVYADDGSLLIEGIDYFVNFPKVVIVSKKHLNNPSTTSQKGTYVFTGHCEHDLSRKVLRDVGFVDHGTLSKNHVYNIRNDKVLRINVGGNVRMLSEVAMDETTKTPREMTNQDGQPYEIRDVVIPVKRYLDTDTYDLRNQEMDADAQMGGYITQHIPDNPDTPNIINGLYLLYSPFASRILSELANNVIQDAQVIGINATSDVISVCRPYEHLLAFDPTQDGQTPDSRYCIIHPWYDNQTVRLTVAQYIFFKKVVDFYLKGKVDISNFVILR